MQKAWEIHICLGLDENFTDKNAPIQLAIFILFSTHLQKASYLRLATDFL